MRLALGSSVLGGALNPRGAFSGLEGRHMAGVEAGTGEVLGGGCARRGLRRRVPTTVVSARVMLARVPNVLNRWPAKTAAAWPLWNMTIRHEIPSSRDP